MVERLRTSNSIHTFRRIAIQYPSVVLKNLPALFSLLLDVFEDSTEQSFGLLFSTLQILDLLRPKIFSQDQFQEILDIFFKILESSPPVPGLIPVLIHFINLVSFYTEFLKKSETKSQLSSSLKLKISHITKKANFFKEVAKSFPEITQTNQLIDNLEHYYSDEFYPTFVQPFSQHQIWTVTQSLKKSVLLNREPTCLVSTQNSLKHLITVGEYSAHLLGPFFIHLIPLIFHQDEQIRISSYKLILRYLYFEPSQISNCATNFLRALQSNDPAISHTILKFVSEIFFLLTEHQSAFLLTLFRMRKYASPQLLGIISNLSPVTFKYLHL